MSRALRSGRTLKPMSVALVVAARLMSFSVMPPTARCTNASFTSSRSRRRSDLGDGFQRTLHVGLQTRG